MALFGRNKRKGGFMDEIHCDEPSYLIWKGIRLAHSWEPTIGKTPSAGVPPCESKMAKWPVFVYKQKNGTMQDFIVGPFDETIKTANFPVLASIVGACLGRRYAVPGRGLLHQSWHGSFRSASGFLSLMCTIPDFWTLVFRLRCVAPSASVSPIIGSL